MSLRYCFEASHVRQTLNRSKPSDLAVIDSEGIAKWHIQLAVACGVFIYDYLNVRDAFVTDRQKKNITGEDYNSKTTRKNKNLIKSYI